VTIKEPTQQQDEEVAQTSEESLQETENPLEQLKQHEAVMAHQEPSQQTAQAANQNQPTRTSTGNQHKQIPNKTALSTPAIDNRGRQDTNDASARIDSNISNPDPPQEQAKSLEQDTRKSKEQIQLGQHPKDHTKAQNEGTQGSASGAASQVDMTMHPTRPTELLPKEWQKHHA